MGRDTKIGLVVVLSILFLFGAIVVRKLQTTDTPGESDKGARAGAKDGKPAEDPNGRRAETVSLPPATEVVVGSRPEQADNGQGSGHGHIDPAMLNATTATPQFPAAGAISRSSPPSGPAVNWPAVGSATPPNPVDGAGPAMPPLRPIPATSGSEPSRPGDSSASQSAPSAGSGGIDPSSDAVESAGIPSGRSRPGSMVFAPPVTVNTPENTDPAASAAGSSPASPRKSLYRGGRDAYRSHSGALRTPTGPSFGPQVGAGTPPATSDRSATSSQAAEPAPPPSNPGVSGTTGVDEPGGGETRSSFAPSVGPGTATGVTLPAGSGESSSSGATGPGATATDASSGGGLGIAPRPIEASLTRAPTAMAPVGSEENYQVQGGDTFWTLSQRKYGSGKFFRALADYNKAQVPDVNQLKLGQALRIPPKAVLEAQMAAEAGSRPDGGAAPAANAAADAADAAALAGRHHRVKKDDNLFNIARDELGHGARWTEIYELNRDRLTDPARLPLDMVLKLPEGAGRERIATGGRDSGATKKD